MLNVNNGNVEITTYVDINTYIDNKMRDLDSYLHQIDNLKKKTEEIIQEIETIKNHI